MTKLGLAFWFNIELSTSPLILPSVTVAFLHSGTYTMSTSANFVAPGQQRYLRACMVCSIVMTYSVRPLQPQVSSSC